jgi:hypothetical protein
VGIVWWARNLLAILIVGINRLISLGLDSPRRKSTAIQLNRQRIIETRICRRRNSMSTMDGQIISMVKGSGRLGIDGRLKSIDTGQRTSLDGGKQVGVQVDRR